MTFQEPILQWLRARDDGETPGEELLNLLKDPFSGTVSQRRFVGMALASPSLFFFFLSLLCLTCHSLQLASASVYSALGTSLGFTAIVALLFSFLRPYNQAVYAPKLKHADEKHAPPPLGKKPWSWVLPLMSTHEEKLVQQIGMDATVFLRVMRMCRNIFVILALIGVGVLVPVHYKLSVVDTQNTVQDSTSWILEITPLNIWGRVLWVQVVIAWVFDIVVCFFLWWNYRRITQLRRKYFEGEDYQSSLHSRTLMVSPANIQHCGPHAFLSPPRLQQVADRLPQSNSCMIFPNKDVLMKVSRVSSMASLPTRLSRELPLPETSRIFPTSLRRTTEPFASWKKSWPSISKTPITCRHAQLASLPRRIVRMGPIQKASDWMPLSITLSEFENSRWKSKRFVPVLTSEAPCLLVLPVIQRSPRRMRSPTSPAERSLMARRLNWRPSPLTSSGRICHCPAPLAVAGDGSTVSGSSFSPSSGLPPTP